MSVNTEVVVVVAWPLAKMLLFTAVSICVPVAHVGRVGLHAPESFVEICFCKEDNHAELLELARWNMRVKTPEMARQLKGGDGGEGGRRTCRF